MNAVRKRKCKAPGCDVTFQPRGSFQPACSPACALAWVRSEKARKARREKREGRERLKSRRDWLADAQRCFNAFIRERDKYLACVSCGATQQSTEYLKISGWVASHYRSVGACPELRFNEANVHKACVRCNSHLSGNIAEYRLGLKRRIGAEALAELEGPHEPAKYTVDDLKAICVTYRAKLKDLKHEPGTFAKLSSGAFA